jgi:hypothetical protein
MKTAMHLLIEELEKDGYQFNHEVIEKHIELEKQQIIDAYEKDMSSNGNLSFESGIEYYTNTFNQ